MWKDNIDLFLESKVALEEFLIRFQDETDRETFDKLIKIFLEKNYIVGEESKNETRQITFAVTERCNLSCIHCCYDAKCCVENTDMSIEQAYEVIDKIVDARPKEITLSGGEPLMRTDFLILLRYLRKKFEGQVNLSTNALLITDRNIDELINSINSFSISLDGYDEKSCAEIRGKGVFDKVIAIVKKLKSKGAKRISLSMVLCGKNKEEKNIEAFRQLNKDLGTECLVRALAPIGRGCNLSNAQKYMEELYKTEEFDSNEAKSYTRLCRCYTCAAVTKDLLINFDGAIYPCGLLIDKDYTLGNIFDESSIQEMYTKISHNQGYKKFLEINPDIFEPCRECKVNLFCWHCLQELDLAKRHPEIIPLRCKMRKNNLMKVVWQE